MDEKYGSKKKQIDLANRTSELDQLFDSVINRLPDLCMPPSYRLAGEDDFFNCTKDIKLKPFRKQRVFDTCISPELILKSNLKPYHSDSELNRSLTPDFKVFSRTQTPNNQSALIRDFNINEASTSKSIDLSNNRNKKKRTKEQVDLERKRLIREDIKKRYSKLNVKHKINEEKKDNRIGYDKLFTAKPSTNYPYLNPIPDCMMTDDNIDNLKDIIVSAVDIEWKMLTPVRPQNEYEEKFFDRLVQLHRYRYKTRLETGYFSKHQTVPFKHIRHTFLVQYDQLKQTQTSASTLGANLARRKSRRKVRKMSTLSSKKKDAKPNIPMLTLTSDEVNSKKIDASDEESAREDDFDYEYYSRFSKRNLRNISSHKNQEQSSNNATTNTLDETRDLDTDQGVFEDRIEEILSRLVNTNL